MTAPIDVIDTAIETAIETVVEADLETAPPVEVVEEDVLVEDVSIDGMCGVY